MTQEQFIKQEVYQFIRSQDEAIDAVELARRIDEREISYSFNEEGDKIHIEGCGYNHVMGWSDTKGIYSLVDEDRDFDEKFQEEEE